MALSQYFNPRSPHGERPAAITSSARPEPFQSTLPARGATKSSGAGACWKPFQSTLPARGATRFNLTSSRQTLFQSTLPARGATQSGRSTPNTPLNFNPRSPHGERPISAVDLHLLDVFQSTLPARGATYNDLHAVLSGGFQSTLPARGATLLESENELFQKNFNPRSPHGERPL